LRLRRLYSLEMECRGFLPSGPNLSVFKYVSTTSYLPATKFRDLVNWYKPYLSLELCAKMLPLVPYVAYAGLPVAYTGGELAARLFAQRIDADPVYLTFGIAQIDRKHEVYDCVIDEHNKFSMPIPSWWLCQLPRLPIVEDMSWAKLVNEMVLSALSRAVNWWSHVY